MTSYEKELLALAVDACKVDLLIERVRDEALQATLWEVGLDESNGHRAETLAEALTALLHDLGVEVPERPSAERVDAVWQVLVDAEDFGEFLNWMRDHDDRDAVLALLEGGER